MNKIILIISNIYNKIKTLLNFNKVNKIKEEKKTANKVRRNRFGFPIYFK
jgi:hypothetical protein